MLQIFYTGIGANQGGIHSVKEFLEIMFREFGGLYDYHQLDEWLEFSGAEIIKN